MCFNRFVEFIVAKYDDVLCLQFKTIVSVVFWRRRRILLTKTETMRLVSVTSAPVLSSWIFCLPLSVLFWYFACQQRLSRKVSILIVGKRFQQSLLDSNTIVRRHKCSLINNNNLMHFNIAKTIKYFKALYKL